MRILVLSTIISLLSLTNCEGPTKVTLEGGNPPTFFLSGSGNLEELRIYGPKQRDAGSDLSFVIWSIVPIKGRMEGELIENIGEIKYGVVPNGYRQEYPENSAPAPALVPGQRYNYWFITMNAPHARAYFEIRGDKVVEVPE